MGPTMGPPLLGIALCTLSKRKMIPPGLQTGLRRWCMGLVRVVHSGGGHESICTRSWRGTEWRRLRTRWALGRRAGLSGGRTSILVGDSVCAGTGGAVAGCTSLAVAAPVAKRLKVLPHALLLAVSWYTDTGQRAVRTDIPTSEHSSGRSRPVTRARVVFAMFSTGSAASERQDEGRPSERRSQQRKSYNKTNPSVENSCICVVVMAVRNQNVSPPFWACKRLSRHDIVQPNFSRSATTLTTQALQPV